MLAQQPPPLQREPQAQVQQRSPEQSTSRAPARRRRARRQPAAGSGTIAAEGTPSSCCRAACQCVFAAVALLLVVLASAALDRQLSAWASAVTWQPDPAADALWLACKLATAAWSVLSSAKAWSWAAAAMWAAHLGGPAAAAAGLAWLATERRLATQHLLRCLDQVGGVLHHVCECW